MCFQRRVVAVISVFCFFVAFPACLLGSDGEESQAQYACENTFTFGFWGSEPRQYDLGFEALLRDICRYHMNCLVAGPRLDLGDLDLDKLQSDLDLCERYGVYTMPLTGNDLQRLQSIVEGSKAHPMILGWYIRDEPSPEFLDEFLKCKALVSEIAPRQPAICLFYRPDSAMRFASYQPVMLTDSYPLAYMHNGTSLGMQFAVREGIFSLFDGFVLADGMSKFNMWGNRGILEWMDLIRSVCGDRPHWITLQAFESGDGHEVRWRAPTITELRLQVYLAIAGGAKGINFFRYELMADPFGNPLPNRHGEGTPMLEELSRLGEELLPIGPLLVESDPADPITCNTTYRPTLDPGKRIEVRRLRSKTRDIDYLALVNYDVLERSSGQINLHNGFLKGRGLYDLTSLSPVPMKEWAGAVSFDVELMPGGGRIFCIAHESDFQDITNTVLEGR
ncbi:MAG: hypothetical protein ABIH23_29565, partial [bacterium]